MKLGSTRTFLAATMIASMCLLGVGKAIGIAAIASAQGSQAAAAQSGQRPPMTEEVYKSVMLLRGIPVDTFFDAMGMFANAMGEDCTFCHAPSAPYDRAAFATPTPRIMRARQMIVMMNAINKTYFAGQPRVTCFTCHGGNTTPPNDPNLALQYGPIVEDPNARNLALDPRISPNQVFDKYLEAVGGTERLARLSSFTAKGTYAGFDTGFDKVPVEIFAKAPDLQTMIVHLPTGDTVTTFDGRNGWMAGPETPLPLVTLTSGNLDRARLEAMLSFPAGIRQAYSQWRVGRAVLNDEEVVVVQATDGGQPFAAFYFDDSGMLLRVVRWTQTPVGFVPTQIEYADYRDVAGVRIPFRRTVTQTYMQMVVELSEVQPNVVIDPARFSQPAPVARRAP